MQIYQFVFVFSLLFQVFFFEILYFFKTKLKYPKTTENRASVQQPFKTQFLPQKAKSAFKPYMLYAVFLVIWVLS
jgi:hypothetical protein